MHVLIELTKAALTPVAECDGKTLLTVKWTALNATAEEQKTFDTSHGSMNQGWVAASSSSTGIWRR